MAKYIGPVACYRKKAQWQIWESVNLDPMFTEPVFLQMKNDSQQVTWRGDKYALEQTSVLFETDMVQGEGNRANEVARDEDVYIDIGLSVPALLIKGNKNRKEVSQKIKKDYKDKMVSRRQITSGTVILITFRVKS